MGILLILFCILITLCGFIPLIIDIAEKGKNRASESVIIAILTKVFTLTSLPCLMVGAVIVTLEFFINGEGISKLVIIALCTVFSAIVSFIMHIRQCKPYYSGLREERAEHKAAFEFIGVWNEAITMNTAEHDSFSRFAAKTVAHLNAVCKQIDDYISFQKESCLSLLDKKAYCENIFVRLAETAEKCAASFSGFKKRLDAANASLSYFYESGSIKNEIGSSLFEELRLRTNELDGQIQKILSKLEMIEFRTSNFADFAKPYKQTIGIYATRIESTLDYIIKKNVVSGNLAEIIILTLYAAQYLKSGIDALLHDIDVKIQSTREEMKKTTQSAEKRVLDAEQRADTAEAKLRATEAESAAIKERSAKAVRPAMKPVQSGIANEAYETLSKKYGMAIWQHNQLETKYDSLLNDYNRSKDIWGIHVTSLKTGNSDKNNKWLTKPGRQLNAKDIRFLNPYLTVDSLISGNKTFYVKIINPDGTINRNSSSSPEGYSFSKVRYLTIGKNQEVDLDGWGNDDRSTYAAGIYTIEVWYEGVQLIAEKCTLH